MVEKKGFRQCTKNACNVFFEHPQLTNLTWPQTGPLCNITCYAKNSLVQSIFIQKLCLAKKTELLIFNLFLDHIRSPTLKVCQGFSIGTCLTKKSKKKGKEWFGETLYEMAQILGISWWIIMDIFLYICSSLRDHQGFLRVNQRLLIDSW